MDVFLSEASIDNPLLGLAHYAFHRTTNPYACFRWKPITPDSIYIRPYIPSTRDRFLVPEGTIVPADGSWDVLKYYIFPEDSSRTRVFYLYRR